MGVRRNNIGYFTVQCALFHLCFSTHFISSVYHKTDKVASPRVTLHPSEPIYSHMLSVGHCVCAWLCILGREDGWGRKHKLQAGLLRLALCPTSDTLLIYSEAYNCRLAKPQFTVDVKTQFYTHYGTSISILD